MNAAEIIWTLAAALAFIPIVLLLRGAWLDWDWLRDHGIDVQERRILAWGDVRRGLIYTVIVGGNVLIGVLALATVRAPEVTVPLLIAAPFLVGVEAWLAVIDQRRLVRARMERNRRKGG
jgi:hypothetical protein